jgi:hypothetical protein
MPIDYAADEQQRVIRLTVRNPLGLGDVTGALDRQIAEGQWTWGTLVDARLTALGPSEAGALFKAVRELVAMHGPVGPIALVTRNPEFVGSVQVFAFRSNEINLSVEVFWDIAEASEWLSKRLGSPRSKTA